MQKDNLKFESDVFFIVKPPIHPYIPIVIGVISITLSVVFIKMSTADAGVIAFYRMFFSVLIMLPIIAIAADIIVLGDNFSLKKK